MQNFYLDPQSPLLVSGAEAILDNIKELIAMFGEAGRPVIFTRHVHHRKRLDAGVMG